MKRARLPTIALLLLSFAAAAQSGWKDGKDDPLSDSDAAKSKDGFSATLIITSDQDWLEKWNTSPETIPHFTEGREVAEGGELAILAFLANPKVDASGMTDVACDFVVTRPDGSKSTEELDMPCFKVKLTADPAQVYLSAASLKYVAEPTDLRGTWNVSVTVKDRHRNVALPLRASFVVR